MDVPPDVWAAATPDGKLGYLGALAQAHATVKAADYSGLFTLAAGTLALVGGFLAYRGAKMQANVIADRHRAKSRAFAFYVLGQLKDRRLFTGKEQDRFRNAAEPNPDGTRTRKRQSPLSLDMPESLSPSEWEQKALLPDDVVKSLNRYAYLSMSGMLFQKYIANSVSPEVILTGNYLMDVQHLKYTTGISIEFENKSYADVYDSILSFIIVELDLLVSLIEDFVRE